jgi:hypothetical protein
VVGAQGLQEELRFAHEHIQLLSATVDRLQSQLLSASEPTELPEDEDEDDSQFDIEKKFWFEEEQSTPRKSKRRSKQKGKSLPDMKVSPRPRRTDDNKVPWRNRMPSPGPTKSNLSNAPTTTAPLPPRRDAISPWNG